MPINAKFLADFQNFYTAVQKAEGSLRSMEVGASKVGPAVDASTKTASLSFQQMATAAAAVSAVIAGVSLAVGKLGVRGADVNDVRQSFTGLTTAIGGTSDAILGQLRAATLGTISDFELMQTANLGMSQGLKLTAEQFGTVGDVAAVLADRTGGDLKTAFDTLTQAMATGQDRTLKTIGINIDAAKATADYAASIGKKVSELDEDQKKQAISNAILAEGERILKQSGKAQKDFADQVAGSSAKMSNFVDRIGAWVATSPKIGAWTSTITAASSTVTAIGLAFGPVSAGVMKLIPLLGLSGLGGAFASLGTVITATVIPALGTVFAFLSPFLLPLAAVATAIGVVYLAWKNWDTIGPIVERLYTAVKTWIFDKLSAIFDSVKAKIDMVTGAFKNMYDKVVGGSYVPDMVAGIASEFGKLNGAMVNPSVAAASAVQGVFNQLLGNLGGMLGQFGQAAGKWLDGLIGGLSAKWSGAVAGIGAMASGGSWKAGAGSAASAGIAAGMGVSAASMTAGTGLALGASIATGAATAGIGLAAVGVYKGIQAWMGQREHMAVNNLRDAWFAKEGGLKGVNEAAQAAGDADFSTTRAIFAAKTKDDFARRVADWERLTGGGRGFAGGTQGQFVDFGPGTWAKLHGKEKIVTQREGREEAAGWKIIDERLQNVFSRMERDRRRFPHQIATAVRDAIVQAG